MPRGKPIRLRMAHRWSVHLSLVASLAVVLLLTAGQTRAQYPRTVLLEEATNWGCGPCAIVNPEIREFLDQYRRDVIQISYHAYWPDGSDPVYLNDPELSRERINAYYRMGSVPSVAVDGRDPFVPGYNSILSAFYQRSATESPVKIELQRSVFGREVELQVRITSAIDLLDSDSAFLRIAEVEARIDTTGSNGEQLHFNVVRGMLPHAKGTHLILRKGESQNFIFNYVVKPSYRLDRMHETAFVQIEKTREVLQAASTRLQLAREQYRAVARAGTPIGVVIQSRSATPEPVTVSVVGVDPSGTLAKDWIFTLDGGSIPQAGRNHTLAPGDATPLAIGASTTAAPVGSGSFVRTQVELRSESSGVVIDALPLKFIHQDVHIANVDRTQAATKSYTDASLTRLAEFSVPLSMEEMIELNGWNPQEFGLIVAGFGKTVLTPTERDLISYYVGRGGRLLLHGTEIAFGLGDPSVELPLRDEQFLRSALHAEYVRDIDTNRLLVASATESIAKPYRSRPLVIVPRDSRFEPDAVRIFAPAVPILYYGSDTAQASSSVAAYKWQEGNARVIHYAFGLQNLGQADRDTLIERSIAWLRGTIEDDSVTTPEEPAGFSDFSVYPNPIRGEATLYVPRHVEGELSARLYSADGRMVRVVFEGSLPLGERRLPLDAKGLASGAYFLRLRLGSNLEILPLRLHNSD